MPSFQKHYINVLPVEVLVQQKHHKLVIIKQLIMDNIPLDILFVRVVQVLHAPQHQLKQPMIAMVI